MSIKDANSGLSVTRRGFLAGLAGAGAAVALYGCAGKGGMSTYASKAAIPYDSKDFVYGTSAHTNYPIGLMWATKSPLRMAVIASRRRGNPDIRIMFPIF